MRYTADAMLGCVVEIFYLRANTNFWPWHQVYADGDVAKQVILMILFLPQKPIIEKT